MEYVPGSVPVVFLNCQASWRLRVFFQSGLTVRWLTLTTTAFNDMNYVVLDIHELVLVTCGECDVAFHFDWVMCVRLEFASGLHYWCIAEHIFEHFVRQQRFRGVGVYLHIDVKSVYFCAFPPVVFARLYKHMILHLVC